MSDSDNQVKKYDPKKIQEFTRQGEFKGLHNKVEAIDSVIKERTQAIRRGEYDTSRQRGDYQRILKADSSLTDRNKKDVKKLLNTWGTQSQKLASPKSIPKAVKKELP
ncbi:hypothetical protein GW804_03775, partial [Candidatus Falkowbacteria bacterium]|nr:hypothetical protein [Candidatus Falkowbacteria bacterium]